MSRPDHDEWMSGEYREAMDLWREDAEHAAAGFDPEAVTRRVLAARSPEAAAPGLAALRASRRYAAAAVILIGLGLGGAAWLGPQADASDPPTIERVTNALEQDHLDLIAAREWDRFHPEDR